MHPNSPLLELFNPGKRRHSVLMHRQPPQYVCPIHRCTIPRTTGGRIPPFSQEIRFSQPNEQGEAENLLCNTRMCGSNQRNDRRSPT